MNTKHLYWMLPSTLLLGFLFGIFFGLSGTTYMYNNYDMIECIYNLEDSINPSGNKLPFTSEAQRDFIEWRCIKEYINNSNENYLDTFELK